MKSQHKCVVVFALVCCCAVLIALIFSAVDVWGDEEESFNEGQCGRSCRVLLLENIPEDVSLPYEDSVSLRSALGDLLDQARRSVEIVSPRWTLNSSDQTHLAQARQGQLLLHQLISLRSRSVSVRVVSGLSNSSELNTLARRGADVHYLNMKTLTKGELSSSFWIVDRKHLYMGSAGMDWRSLSTMKEFGLVLLDCSCLVADLHRVFSLYWQLQYKEFVPSLWSKKLSALTSRDQNLRLQLDDTEAQVYISTSPDVFCTRERTKDLEAISRVIQEAQSFIYISIPDYLPLLNRSQLRYWSGIDSMLREALLVKSGISVRVLVSCWTHTHPLTHNTLWSLQNLCFQTLSCSVEARFFSLPQPDTLNRSRFVLTDTSLYIGSQSWMGSEFVSSAGVGLVIRQQQQGNSSSVLQRIRAVFDRDWHSQYSRPLHTTHSPACTAHTHSD
ncbi:inactive phospholipase D5-like isoform X2 [Danio rerio]|uniref:Inactive phospholipase D5-like isoform X2 n=1 Tax=Danio rerio TaxID=7955 RepID=A0AC58H3G9_DANRE